jgi:hypothetical protein
MSCVGTIISGDGVIAGGGSTQDIMSMEEMKEQVTTSRREVRMRLVQRGEDDGERV